MCISLCIFLGPWDGSTGFDYLIFFVVRTPPPSLSSLFIHLLIYLFIRPLSPALRCAALRRAALQQLRYGSALRWRTAAHL